MMFDGRFFPFNPQGTRQSFLFAAMACGLLTMWATVSALQGNERLAAVRALASAVLLVAFLLGWFRLRPRDGWGVTVTASGLRIAKPFSTEALEVEWRQIQGARREGRGGGTLNLFLKQGGQLHIGRPLFPTAKDFNDVVDAISDRLPTSPFDA